MRFLTDRGLYGAYILESYTREELDEAEAYLVESRNELLNFSGLDLLLRRYVIRSHENRPLETPQEMFLGIAPASGDAGENRQAFVGTPVL